VLQGAVFVSGIAVAFDALLHEPPALARPAGAVESADFAAAAAVAADFVVVEPDAVVADAGLRSSGVGKKSWPCHFSD